MSNEVDRAAGPPDSSELFPLVYAELKAIAGRLFRGQPRDHTLQPTALVHEAYLKLADHDRGRSIDRSSFLAAAAAAMRNLLVDHARRKGRQKRGGDWRRTRLDALLAETEERTDVLSLDEALRRLAGLDARLAEVVELRFFGGLTIAETAEVLAVGTTTVEDRWAAARAWLTRELGGDRVA